MTRLARGVDEPDVRAGERYVVEYVGQVESGGLYVTLLHPPVALVERLGDEWAIVGEGQL